MVFLLAFMLLIFGPAEIFFANVAEFEFLYGEFAGYLTILAFFAAVPGTAVLIFLPKKLRKLILSLIFGASLAGYLQVMLWNKGLDLLGLNPEGYQAAQSRIWGNLLLWLGIFALVVALAFWKEYIWEKIVVLISAFLLCIQLVALISLMLTAKDSAYKRTDGQYVLSGEEQLTVSGKKNIIVFVLDYFSDESLIKMQEEYPGATDFLHDFTYYDNDDCVYFGTYPSLPHMLTGCEVDMSMGVNEWCASIWENEKTLQFYNELKKKDYVINLYTPDTNILCGINDTGILEGKFSNLVNSSDEVVVSHRRLFKTIIKMSCYRMFPEILKPYFYTNMSEYGSIVGREEHQVLHYNYEFYEALLNRGITEDRKSNYFMVQHLSGLHELTNDADGFYTLDSGSVTATAKGCMVVVEEYLNQLKALGVYDDSTIIITADHGAETTPHVIFFVKEPGEVHDVSFINRAPISHKEFLPTLAEYVGIEYTQYGSGQSIHDFGENEIRERIFWVRGQDVKIPFVSRYTGEGDGIFNVYYGYHYTGGLQEARNIDWNSPEERIEMIDTFF